MIQASRFLRCGGTSLARCHVLRPVATLTTALSLPISSSTCSQSGHSYRQYHQGTAYQHANSSKFNAAAAAAAVISTAGALWGSSFLQDCQCEAPRQEDKDNVNDDEEDLPTYTMAQVAKNNGKNGGDKIWMTYGGNVYDVTDFIANHPGGSEKIMLAAGGPIEPHWNLYRQHFASQLPMQYMEKMLIGYLSQDDQDVVDELMEQLATAHADSDPYGREPTRSPLLKVHGDMPMNAEVPREVLLGNYITPTEVFYIRHHHPVPLLSEEEIEDFRLDVDLALLLSNNEEEKDSATAQKKQKEGKNQGSGTQKQRTAKLSLEQIKSLPKAEVITTLQCSGNRRSGFNDYRQTSGTPWDQGAISTAKWGGARLVDVLMLASEQLLAKESSSANEKNNGTKEEDDDSKKKGNNLLSTLQSLQSLINQNPQLQHLRFESLDGLMASIDIIKALNPYGDVLIAYEMNDEPLPRDHGYPLRVIVPGFAAIRNVKWLSKLELATDPAEGTWQRGLNYKVLPPCVVDVREVDLEKMPSLTEESVFSGITNVSRVEGVGLMVPGETVLVTASGWAWAGGGRNIVRVDVTGNNGLSWANAKITQGSDQPYGRAWAWVFWECPAVPATVSEDGVSVELSVKGVDMAFNTQPESSNGLWNVRGLANNSWYRLRHRVV